MGVKPEQLRQMAVSTNHNLSGHVMQLLPALSDTENYWGFQGYSPFQWVSKPGWFSRLHTYLLTHSKFPQPDEVNLPLKLMAAFLGNIRNTKQIWKSKTLKSHAVSFRSHGISITHTDISFGATKLKTKSCFIILAETIYFHCKLHCTEDNMFSFPAATSIVFALQCSSLQSSVGWIS